MGEREREGMRIIRNFGFPFPAQAQLDLPNSRNSPLGPEPVDDMMVEYLQIFTIPSCIHTPGGFRPEYQLRRSAVMTTRFPSARTRSRGGRVDVTSPVSSLSTRSRFSIAATKLSITTAATSRFFPSVGFCAYQYHTPA